MARVATKGLCHTLPRAPTRVAATSLRLTHRQQSRQGPQQAQPRLHIQQRLQLSRQSRNVGTAACTEGEAEEEEHQGSLLLLLPQKAPRVRRRQAAKQPSSQGAMQPCSKPAKLAWWK